MVEINRNQQTITS